MTQGAEEGAVGQKLGQQLLKTYLYAYLRDA